MPVSCTFTELIIDARNPQRLSEFWCAALGWEPTGRYEGALEIGASDGSIPSITFVPNNEPKSAKNRVHIDVNPRGCDQAAEVARLIVLGAQRVDIGQGQQTWVVLADPEGNEFCVLEERRDQP